jgi:hypothetical protein
MAQNCVLASDGRQRYSIYIKTHKNIKEKKSFSAAGKSLSGDGSTEIVSIGGCRLVACLFLEALTDSRPAFTSSSHPTAFFMTSSTS